MELHYNLSREFKQINEEAVSKVIHEIERTKPRQKLLLLAVLDAMQRLVLGGVSVL